MTNEQFIFKPIKDWVGTVKVMSWQVVLLNALSHSSTCFLFCINLNVPSWLFNLLQILCVLYAAVFFMYILDTQCNFIHVFRIQLLERPSLFGRDKSSKTWLITVCLKRCFSVNVTIDSLKNNGSLCKRWTLCVWVLLVTCWTNEDCAQFVPASVILRTSPNGT